ncbi:MAG: S1C family serine protease [Planctomycetota bacterium]
MQPATASRRRCDRRSARAVPWPALVAVVVATATASRPAAGAEAGTAPPDSVLAAERDRVAVMARASAAAVAIFAGDAGGGSGVLVSPDGYALTNFHVVQPAGVAMQCGLSDGRLYDAVLVGLDPTGDLALVKLVGRDDFPWAELADSDTVAVGDPCFAAGNPFLLATDFQPSVSAGIVSGVHRYQGPAGTILEYADCIQVDAAINPGNSGGALFDARGAVIGINGRASFEKRGRVNVGVGYAISSNQARHFLGALKGGRIVDHATLGATVATASDGRVVVSDILESSDAYRRGLRYDDEVVALAGRPVRTVNAFKNVLGTLPSGWRVPLVYRRGGQRHEILVRLAAVHAPAELEAIVSGEGGPRQRRRTPGSRRPQAPGDEPPPGEAPAAPAAREPPPLPDALRGLHEARPGFANFHFNLVERDRVAAAIAARPPIERPAGTGRVVGHPTDKEAFRIELAPARASIDLPTGTSTIDAAGELDANPAPPGSGGLLAALVLWRRLILDGPRSLGRTTYLGTVPAATAAGAEPAGTAIPVYDDVLDAAVGGVEARFIVAADGAVTGIDLWTAPDAEPCEVRFAYAADGGVGDAVGLPRSFTVRHADAAFGTFTIDEVVVEPATENADSTGPAATAGDGAGAER